jgi:hypothetical protein
MVLPTAPVDASPSNASISIRDYIYFLPYPLPPGTPVPYTVGLPNVNPLNYPPQAFEPTSTLVLTSPAKTFVDVRILKPVRAGEVGLPNDGGHWERLDWAFAGKSSSRVIPDPYTVCLPYLVLPYYIPLLQYGSHALRALPLSELYKCTHHHRSQQAAATPPPAYAPSQAPSHTPPGRTGSTPNTASALPPL